MKCLLIQYKPNIKRENRANDQHLFSHLNISVLSDSILSYDISRNLKSSIITLITKKSKQRMVENKANTRTCSITTTGGSHALNPLEELLHCGRRPLLVSSNFLDQPPTLLS